MSRIEFESKLRELINLIVDVDRFYNNLHMLCIDLYETPLDKSYTKLLDLYLHNLLHGDDHKIETFYWFIYEYMPNLSSKGLEPCKENAQMWDKDGEPICYNVVTLSRYLYD